VRPSPRCQLQGRVGRHDLHLASFSGPRLKWESFVLRKIIEDLVPWCLRLDVDVHHGARLGLVVQTCKKEHGDLWIGCGPIEKAASTTPAKVSSPSARVFLYVRLSCRDAQICALNHSYRGEGRTMDAPAVATVAVDDRPERTSKLVLDCTAVAPAGSHGPTSVQPNEERSSRRVLMPATTR